MFLVKKKKIFWKINKFKNVYLLSLISENEEKKKLKTIDSEKTMFKFWKIVDLDKVNDSSIFTKLLLSNMTVN